MRVTVVGAGYVGLVTGACLAELGHDVVCADLDEQKVGSIQAGVSPIYEPGLDELIARHAGERLRATLSVHDAVTSSELTFLAVGTPLGEQGLDLRALRSAATAVGEALAEVDEYHVVVVKSSVVPGTTMGDVRKVLEDASGKRVGEDVGLCVNPEFLTEGQAVEDFMSPDRIVFGSSDERSLERLERLYESYSADVPRVRTNPATAEMIKFASNAMLATQISFANEIANLCAAIGDIDVVDVQQGLHLSRYLTPLASDGQPVRAPIASFLEAGCGFGGSCLPKDVRALVLAGREAGQPMRVLASVLETNEAQPRVLVDIVGRGLGGLSERRIAVLGLAFKPGTDDVRESPAIPVVQGLLAGGADVTVHDPVVSELPAALDRPGVRLTSDLEEALSDQDAVVLVTRWAEYRDVADLLSRLDPAPLFVDGRRMVDRRLVSGYAGIGM